MSTQRAVIQLRIKELYQANSVVGNDLRAKELYNLLVDSNSYTVKQLEKYIIVLEKKIS